MCVGYAPKYPEMANIRSPTIPFFIWCQSSLRADDVDLFLTYTAVATASAQ